MFCAGFRVATERLPATALEALEAPRVCLGSAAAAAVRRLLWEVTGEASVEKLLFIADAGEAGDESGDEDAAACNRGEAPNVGTALRELECSRTCNESNSCGIATDVTTAAEAGPPTAFGLASEILG